ncbi:MAG TPA: L,D-transpeptidase family protein [Clostridiales bacterium]|nr:L,D-transpeptidase family protein [Clostridiales bacterium]
MWEFKRIRIFSSILILLIINIMYCWTGIGGIDYALAQSSDDNFIKLVGAAYIQPYGNIDIMQESHNYIVGAMGLKNRLESMSFDIENQPDDMMLVYRGCVQNYGDIPNSENENTWRDPVTGELWLKAPAYLGIIGEGKNLVGIQMRLIDKNTGKDYKDYKIQYQIYTADLGWLDKVSNGSFAGVKGRSLGIDAIAVEIKKERKLPKVSTSSRSSRRYIQDIEEQIKASPVFAFVTEDSKIYSSINGRAIGTVNMGSWVEIIQDRSCIWYQIKENGRTGWIKGKNLLIPQETPTNKDKLTDEELEMYVNYKKFSSSTPYFIWVDIDRQLTHVFKGSIGNWQLEKTMVCATGKNKSPTIRGTFKIQDRGRWFYSDRLQSGAKNWMRFYNSYLFHSIAFDDRRNVQDDTLGAKVSSGCVRLSIEDSEYLYEIIPEGTTVWIN